MKINIIVKPTILYQNKKWIKMPPYINKINSSYRYENGVKINCCLDIQET